ncbi:YdbT family protein [Fulvivirga sediminis]|uniref:Uncharacterized protein n=1 Tax=Fulvivirga sediminis TaxID=2803949 RepID=A0A937FEE9_9BACT|nr:hypothetical protein [Fulvivirga sediminis]MBL3659008.1 hypothetical protein [Fulvivirga sediminis]
MDTVAGVGQFHYFRGVSKGYGHSPYLIVDSHYCMSESRNKRRLSDFGDSIFLIVLGIGFFWMTRSPELKDITNTSTISSILTTSPKSGVHGESQDYIGFHLAGHDDFFEFTKCSYNNRIRLRIEALQVGDSITIHINKSSSSTTYPRSGKKYFTYRICAASSPKHGSYLEFSQYNYCLEKKASIWYPLLCGVLILIGLFQIGKKLKDKDNFFSTKYLHLDEQGSEEIYFRLHPSKTSYFMSKLVGPIISLIVGLLLLIFTDSITWNYIGYGAVGLGIYLILHYLRIHSKIFYILDNEGVHIKNVTTFFQEEIKAIHYNSIQEVTSKRKYYQYDSKVGTVLIYSGKTDDEGDKIYDKLIGIEKYSEVVDFISKLIKNRKNTTVNK